MIFPSDYSTPTLSEIARTLAGLRRWNNRTVVPWSVLQHSLAGASMVADENPIRKIHFLAHDSEEALTGDIPKPYKTADMSELGDGIREDIFVNVYRIPYPESPSWEYLDEVMEIAEREVLLHPKRRKTFGGAVEIDVEDAVDAIWELLRVPEHLLIDKYIAQVNRLMASPQVRTLEGRI